VTRVPEELKITTLVTSLQLDGSKKSHICLLLVGMVDSLKWIDLRYIYNSGCREEQKISSDLQTKSSQAAVQNSGYFLACKIS